MNYKELKEKAEKARQTNNSTEMLKYYSQLIEFEEANYWDKYFYALALFRNGKKHESLDYCRKLYKEKPNFKPLKSLYARNILANILENITKINNERIIKALSAMLNLIDKDDEFFPFRTPYYYIMKELDQKKKYSTLTEILKYFDFRNNECSTAEKKDKELPKFPPECETWYVFAAKTAFATGDYTKTIEIIDESLSKIKKFYYSNDIWLKRIKAKSFAHLKNYNEALKIYFEIMHRKKDWFLMFEVAKILMQSGNAEASVYFAMNALRDNQKIDYKLNLIKWLFETKQNIIDKENLIKLYHIIKKRLKKQQLDENEIKNEKFLIKKLKENTKQYFDKQQVSGKIIKIFNQKNGLIFCNEKNFFYFSRVKDLKVGDEITGFLTWNYDRKKQKVRQSVIIQGKQRKSNAL